MSTRIPSAKYLLAATFLGGALLAAFPAAAQAPAGPLPPKPGVQAQQPSEQSNIRVKVNLINTPVVVTDNKGEMILDLSEKSFRVYDNGVQQSIEDFDVGGGQPLSLAIVVETSSRIGALLPAMRKTGILFTQTVLGPDGEAAVIGFNDEVDRLQPLTTDDDAIEKAFTNLQQGTSGARLYDALGQAVEMLRSLPTGRRRVIITLAEAADSGSEQKLGQVLKEAQLNNITIYSVGLSSTAATARGEQKSTVPLSGGAPGTLNSQPFPGQPQGTTLESPNAGGNVDLLALSEWAVKHAAAIVREHPLEIATTGTGGLYTGTFKDKSIETAIDRIGGELHSEYTLTYRPVGTDPIGYHEIRVVVTRPGLTVRCRPGYYLDSPAA